MFENCNIRSGGRSGSEERESKLVNFDWRVVIVVHVQTFSF